MKKLYSMTLALIVLLSTAVSVEALESKSMQRSNGAHASADWTETNGNATIYTYLSATETDNGNDIYVSLYTYDHETGYSSEKYGYMFTEDDVFSINKKLNSASLSEVEIEVFEWYYDETEGYYYTEEAGTLTVSADWIGIGEVSKGSFRSSSRDGDYIFRSADSSLSREAIATGSISGNDLGSSSYAWMNSFKSAYTSIEK